MTSAHAAYISTPLNYSTAEATCQCLGSHLFVAKTLQKFALLSQIVGALGSAWIGLSDRAQESKFVWADDGADFDPVLEPFILIEDGYGTEDCVMTNTWFAVFKLNDQNCAMTLPSLCEKNTP